jgi:hypothetical protein
MREMLRPYEILSSELPKYARQMLYEFRENVHGGNADAAKVQVRRLLADKTKRKAMWKWADEQDRKRRLEDIHAQFQASKSAHDRIVAEGKRPRLTLEKLEQIRYEDEEGVLNMRPLKYEMNGLSTGLRDALEFSTAVSYITRSGKA